MLPPHMQGIEDCGRGSFPTTRWSFIRRAAGGAIARRDVLEGLFAQYWRPVYAYARRRGLCREDAEDVVQGFFARLLEQGFPDGLDPARGRLRGYLRVALDRYLVNQHKSRVAAKRGGGRRMEPLDVERIERDLLEVETDPATAYDREWAHGLMARASQRLAAEYHGGRRRGDGAAILSFFSVDAAPSYAEAAAACGMTVGGFKAALHRARVRFRELVREELARGGDEADAERQMAELLQILRGR